MTKIEEIVKKEVAYLNKGDLDGVCSCYTDDVVFEDASDPDHPAVGMAAFRQSMADYFAGFSDLNVGVTRTLISEDGSGLAIEYLLTGTHDGPYMGVPASGNKLTLLACSVYDLRGDLICKERIYWDMGLFMSQLQK